MPAMERTAWQKYGWLLRWGGTAAGIAYVAHLIDRDKGSTAFGRISAGALIGAIVLVARNVVAGAERWRTLLTAYGANSRPPFHEAVRLYIVSIIFNNNQPGAVAGDVVRGVVTKDVFGERGGTAGLAVVLVERALGLFGVFLLLAIGLGVAGREIDTGSKWVWSPLGIDGSLVLVLALPFARRLAPVMPGKLRALLEKVPALASPVAFVLA